MRIPSWAELYAPVIARVLMGGMFLLAGIQKWMGLSGTAMYIESVGLPAPMVLAVLAALIETVFGAALLVGFRTKLAAAGLLVFTVIATLIFHTGWSANANQQVMFMKNLAIMAGLLYMMSFGSGAFSADRNRSNV
jgi:putative oxidoreductase